MNPMTRPKLNHGPAPEPKAKTLEQQKVDFTAEGAPPAKPDPDDTLKPVAEQP